VNPSAGLRPVWYSENGQPMAALPSQILE